MDSSENTGKIAHHNDLLRCLGYGGSIMLTRSIANLPRSEHLHIMAAIAAFAEFTEDNDPYGERDFGAVIVQGDKYFWKIDYYNSDLSAGSEDPSDPHQTTRVMTIMQAGEY